MTHKNQDSQEIKIIQQIQEGLNLLDEKIEVKTPDTHWLEQWTEKQQLIMKQSLRNEFFKFILMAFMILSITLLIFVKAPVFFYLLQTLTILVIIFYCMKVQQKKQVNKR